MDRSGRSSDSKDNIGNNAEGLPPNGRPKENAKKSVGGDSNNGVGSSSQSNRSFNSGEKKNKFSFFSNLFKSNKTSVTESGHTPGEGGDGARDGLNSSSSYESVNSADTTSSFTFVSSKKFRGKGHKKGKRIPIDDQTLPRPSSSCSNSRPGSAVGGETVLNKTNGDEGSVPPRVKKMGTLSRIGMKMGLKKKYNLQSCESLDHIATLPRPTSQQEKKTKSKKTTEYVSARNSVVVEDSQTSPLLITGKSTNTQSRESTAGPQAEGGTSKISNPNGTEGESHSPIQSLNPELAPVTQKSTPSTSKGLGYVADEAHLIQSATHSGNSSDPNTNTWSSSTKRKRRAPPPPAKSFDCGAIQIPGKNSQQEEAAIKNVQLKSVKRLNDDDVAVKIGGNQLSYPSGALRRNKSKEKSHLRPFSCSCSNSIFAHHSKYQQYHKRSCSDGPPHSTSSNASTLGRTHVKGKKKAPQPPNPFDENEGSDSSTPVSTPSVSTPKQNTNYSTPYRNPFLDEDEEEGDRNNNDRVQIPITNCIEITNAPTVTSSANVTSSSPTILTSSSPQVETSGTVSFSSSSSLSCVLTPLSTTSTAAFTITTTSFSHPISSSECFATESTNSTNYKEKASTDDEIAQNILNDVQEQEQLSSAQGSLSSRNIESDSTTFEPIVLEARPPLSKTSTSNSKQLFNSSSNRNSISHLPREDVTTRNDFEILLHSSQTLMEQARAVDNQVKAQLQDNNKKSTKSFWSSPSNVRMENSSHSLLFPNAVDPQTDAKVVPPIPWYKRSIGGSSSKNSPGVKPLPIKPKHTITCLPKFSDLDREAKLIVEENKRKSAEIAFNKNARDLINIFNTTFITASDSTTTSSVTVSNFGISTSQPASLIMSNSATTSSIVSSHFQAPQLNADPRPSLQSTIDQVNLPTSVALANSSASTPTMIYNMAPVSTTVPFTTLVASNFASNTTLSVQAPSSKSNMITTSSTVPAPYVSATICTTSSNFQAAKIPSKSNTTSVFTQFNKLTVDTSKLEAWSCPRCTLYNPAWRALCEACYCRKLATTICTTAPTTSISSSSATISNSPITTTSAASISKDSTSVVNTSNVRTTTVSTSREVANHGILSVSSPNSVTKTASGTQTDNAQTTSNYLSSQYPISQNKPSCENFLSHHSIKADLLKDEKLHGIKLKNHTGISEDVVDVDIEKVRQVRLAFFTKDQQAQEQNIVEHTPGNSALNNSSENVTSTDNLSEMRFDDGEDNSIDDLIFLPKIQNAPKRPPKNVKVSNFESIQLSPDAVPNFEILLEPNSPQCQVSPTNTINNSAQLLPNFRYRPMLDPISETDPHYYSTREVDNRIYQNWQQPAQPFLETESYVGANATNHFNIDGAHPMAMASQNLQNTSLVHPLLNMRQNIEIPEDSLASSPCAKFRLFPNPIPIQSHQNNDNYAGVDPGLANSHFISSGFTSESDYTEVDSEMDRHHNRRQRGCRDNKHSGGSTYSGERNLSYDDYRRLGAIPKGYGGGYPSGSDSPQRRFEGSGPSSNSDSGRRRNYVVSGRSQYGEEEEDSRYFSESSDNSMTDNILVTNKLLRLEWAIAHGDHRLAASLAHDLALLKVNCVVAKPKTDPITIRVYVEDRFMQQGPFLVQVIPTMTLKDLKSKIAGDWGINAGFQKWILGKKMAEDDYITLANYDVVQDTMAFLYLVTPQIENFKVKDKEVTPPPPPLPKKPTSPNPSAAVSYHVDKDSDNPVRNPTTPMNQLQNTVTTPATFSPVKNKVTSSAQTENAKSLLIPKKPPMPDPEETKIASSSQSQCAQTTDLTNLRTSSIDKGQIPLLVPSYERPTSPTRGERQAPKLLQNTRNSRNVGVDMESYHLKLNCCQIGPSNNSNTGVEKKLTASNTCVSEKSQPISNERLSQSPIPRATLNLNSHIGNKTSVPNNLPLSLHAKLENLRQAAEQAFGKSFSSSAKSGSSPCTVGNILPVNSRNQSTPQTHNLQNDKQSKVVNTTFVKQSHSNKASIQKISNESSSCDTKKQPPISKAPTNSKNLNEPKLQQLKRLSYDKENGEVMLPPKGLDPIIHSKSDNTKAIPKLESVPTPSSPVATSNSPRPPDTSDPIAKSNVMKSIVPEAHADTETEQSINFKKLQKTPVTTQTPETPKAEKVEGFCQTTLPFPESKACKKSSEQSVIIPTEINSPIPSTFSSASTNSEPMTPQILTSPGPSPSLPNDVINPQLEIVKKGPQSKKEPTLIIANVLVSPIINHSLIGTSALLRALSPQPSFYNDIITKPGSPNIDTLTSKSKSPTPPSPSIPTQISDTHIKNFDTPQSAQSAITRAIIQNTGACSNVTITSTSVALTSTTTLSTTSPQPFPIAPTLNMKNNKDIIFKLPYFMQKEESCKNQKTSPSKVKMMAEKFSTNSSNNNGLLSSLRKNSDSSVGITSSSTANKNKEVGRGSAIFSYDGKENNFETYLSMLQMMEKQDLVMSSEEFECPVCLSTVSSGDGVTLRDCLHNFCRDCLIGSVQYADDTEVKCPFRDNNYSCNSSLQEREIKALVPPEIFEKYLARSVKLAERKMMNSFHCKTTDCTGWCIFEDDVNVFKCPVCNKKNCITCAAIHDGMDCMQYQRQLSIAAETDEDAKSSRLMLEKMIQRGEALECPACHVVLLKKWGCDWVRCSFCKTEICWVTKNFRWGPEGKGDVSGGCKCGVHGRQCHPKCTYCH